MKNPKHFPKRREFIKKSGLFAATSLAIPSSLLSQSPFKINVHKIPINAHLWVYASKFPPNWDCTPKLETVFADLSSAGMDGLELMEANLRHDDSVAILNTLSKKYNLKVTGSSYGVGLSMWDTTQHQSILKDIQTVVPRLGEVGGHTFGISVGSADHKKTVSELDAQAEILIKIREICKANDIVPNLHNHTYEVEHNLHDLKGTLDRIPDFKLGPDVNWLIRAEIDPVEFINTYGQQIVYVHLRDQYANGKWTEYLGQGATDFKAIGIALHKQGFHGELAIELAYENDFTPENSLKDNWKKSKKHIENTFDL